MALKKNSRISLFILTLLTFILYVNTLNHDYVLDDFSVIKENRVVKQGLEGIPTIWKTHYRFGYGFQQANSYRPLTLTVFAIQWKLSPDNPHLAHWFNVLIYILLIYLIFRFLSQLLETDQQLTIFITCLLFVAHPIHTEVVANIKSLDELLASGFSFAGLILLLRYLENRKMNLLITSLILFQAAFFSKESTIAIVACIPFML
ncbi:MAG: tetratricopeptide repeat protein, partial [Candidatus Paceibacterota bacterium]